MEPSGNGVDISEVLDRLSCGIVGLDGSRRCIYMNEEAEKILDIGIEEASGKRMSSVADSLNERYETVVAEAASSGLNTSFILDDDSIDGVYKVQTFPGSNGGEDAGVTLFLREEGEDVEEVDDVEELETEKEKYETLVHTNPDPVLVVKTDTGEIVEANSPVTDLGRSKHELTGREFPDIFEDGNVGRELFKAQTGAESFGEPGITAESFRVTEIDGEPIYISGKSGRKAVGIHSTKFQIGDDNYLYMVVLDRTSELEKRKEMEENRNHLEVMDSVLRHHVRNKLSTITGYAELIQDDAEEGSQVMAFAERIENLTWSLDETTETDRRVVKSLTDKTIAVHDLDWAAENAVEDWREKSDATIQYHPPSGDSKAKAVSKIGEALDELLKKAVTDGEEENLEVDVSVDDGIQYVTVTVTDNGSQIMGEEVSLLLGESTKPLHHGKGVGLWLVYNIMKHSGGSVAYSENSPSGNEVTLRFKKA
ncbi:MAG: ATP-binding protein [Halobacteria archaeon]